MYWRRPRRPDRENESDGSVLEINWKGERFNMSKKIRVKPGKGQSAMGMAAGIVFCLIGLFVVIPTFGLFGVLWTAMAAIITVTNGINAFSDRGVSSHEIIIENETGDGIRGFRDGDSGEGDPGAPGCCQGPV